MFNRKLFLVLLLVVLLTLLHLVGVLIKPSRLFYASADLQPHQANREEIEGDHFHDRHQSNDHDANSGGVAVSVATAVPRSFQTKPQQQPSRLSSSSHGDRLHDNTVNGKNNQCTSLELHANASQVGVTAVSLCWSSSRCTGTLTVTLSASVCNEVVKNPPSPLSSNADLKADLLRRGPHLFRLRLDGPEIFTVSQSPVVLLKSSSSCSYTFMISTTSDQSHSNQLKHKKYRIGFEMLYRNFAHLDESRDVWPELLKTPLLQLADDAFDTKYHTQQCTLPSREVLVCRSGISDPDRDETDKAVAREVLPQCVGTEKDTGGVWQRTESGKHVWTRVRVRKIRKEPILFEWAMQSEPEARWVPRACKIVDVTREQFFDIFNGKRIVISGDSQLRALYYAVVNTLNGNGDTCVRNITTLAGEPAVCVANVKGSQRKSLSSSSSNGGGKVVQVDYIDDLFLNRIRHKLKGYDIIIAGFGQHPASKEHWRIDKYKHAVSQRMTDLKKLGVPPKNIIWYAAPHYPHTRAGYPVAVRDWRTDARLELFNNVSFAAAREAGFLTLDPFSISDAFLHTSPDQAHFSNFVAGEFVRMLFSLLFSL